jgi:hypothetical protein
MSLKKIVDRSFPSKTHNNPTTSSKISRGLSKRCVGCRGDPPNGILAEEYTFDPTGLYDPAPSCTKELEVTSHVAVHENTYWCSVGNGWEWGNGTNNYYY